MVGAAHGMKGHLLGSGLLTCDGSADSGFDSGHKLYQERVNRALGFNWGFRALPATDG